MAGGRRDADCLTVLVVTVTTAPAHSLRMASSETSLWSTTQQTALSPPLPALSSKMRTSTPTLLAAPPVVELTEEAVAHMSMAGTSWTAQPGQPLHALRLPRGRAGRRRRRCRPRSCRRRRLVRCRAVAGAVADVRGSRCHHFCCGNSRQGRRASRGFPRRPRVAVGRRRGGGVGHARLRWRRVHRKGPTPSAGRGVGTARNPPCWRARPRRQRSAVDATEAAAGQAENRTWRLDPLLTDAPSPACRAASHSRPRHTSGAVAQAARRQVPGRGVILAQPSQNGRRTVTWSADHCPWPYSACSGCSPAMITRPTGPAFAATPPDPSLTKVHG